MTFPAPPVFPAGVGPYPGDFDAWVQAPLADLTGKVVFRAVQTGSPQTIPAGSNTVLQLNDVVEDPYSGWNTASWSWTPPAAWSGVYVVAVTFAVAPTGGEKITATVGLNGTGAYTLGGGWTNGGLPNVAGGEAPVALVGGQDAVTALGYVSGSSSVATVVPDVSTSLQSSMAILWTGY